MQEGTAHGHSFPLACRWFTEVELPCLDQAHGLPLIDRELTLETDSHAGTPLKDWEGPSHGSEPQQALQSWILCHFGRSWLVPGSHAVPQNSGTCRLERDDAPSKLPVSLMSCFTSPFSSLIHFPDPVAIARSIGPSPSWITYEAKGPLRSHGWRNCCQACQSGLPRSQDLRPHLPSHVGYGHRPFFYEDHPALLPFPEGVRRGGSACEARSKSYRYLDYRSATNGIACRLMHLERHLRFVRGDDAPPLLGTTCFESNSRVGMAECSYFDELVLVPARELDAKPSPVEVPRSARRTFIFPRCWETSACSSMAPWIMATSRHDASDSQASDVWASLPDYPDVHLATEGPIPSQRPCQLYDVKRSSAAPAFPVCTKLLRCQPWRTHYTDWPAPVPTMCYGAIHDADIPGRPRTSLPMPHSAGSGPDQAGIFQPCLCHGSCHHREVPDSEDAFAACGSLPLHSGSMPMSCTGLKEAYMHPIPRIRMQMARLCAQRPTGGPLRPVPDELSACNTPEAARLLKDPVPMDTLQGRSPVAHPYAEPHHLDSVTVPFFKDGRVVSIPATRHTRSPWSTQRTEKVLGGIQLCHVEDVGKSGADAPAIYAGSPNSPSSPPVDPVVVFQDDTSSVGNAKCGCLPEQCYASVCSPEDLVGDHAPEIGKLLAGRTCQDSHAAQDTEHAQDVDLSIGQRDAAETAKRLERAAQLFRKRSRSDESEDDQDHSGGPKKAKLTDTQRTKDGRKLKCPVSADCDLVNLGIMCDCCNWKGSSKFCHVK